MATYAVPTEELKSIRYAKDVFTILISSSTLTLSQSDKYKAEKICSVWDIKEVLRVDSLVHKDPEKEPPEYCTNLIILSLLGLFLPGDWKVFGVCGFITLFFILASLDAKNAKRGKYSLLLTLNDGYQIQVDFKKESFLKEVVAIIYALRNHHYRIINHLNLNNYIVLDLKDSKIINPITKSSMDIGEIVDFPKMRYSTLLDESKLTSSILPERKHITENIQRIFTEINGETVKYWTLDEKLKISTRIVTAITKDQQLHQNILKILQSDEPDTLQKLLPQHFEKLLSVMLQEALLKPTQADEIKKS